jgi:hypothetical protein
MKTAISHGRKMRREAPTNGDGYEIDEGPKVASRKQMASSKVSRRLKLITSTTLDGRTSTSRIFNQLTSQIIQDLGGEQNISAVMRELITSFAASSLLQRDQITRMLAGQEINIDEFAVIAVSLIRASNRIGTERRSRDVTPTLGDLLREDLEQQREQANREADLREEQQRQEQEASP